MQSTAVRRSELSNPDCPEGGTPGIEEHKLILLSEIEHVLPGFRLFWGGSALCDIAKMIYVEAALVFEGVTKIPAGKKLEFSRNLNERARMANDLKIYWMGRSMMNMRVRLVAMAILAGSWAIPVWAESAGETIYTQKCAVCHGPDGQANTPMGKILKAKNYHDPAIVKAPDAELMEVVKKGKGKMPSFSTTLDDAQIKDVIEYVRTLAKGGAGAEH